MTKITKETELREGMEIKLDELIYCILGFTIDRSIGNEYIELMRVKDNKWTTSATKEYLVESNAEILETKTKVVVSAEVLQRVEVYRTMEFPFLYWAFKLWDSLPKDFEDELLTNYNASNQDLFNIYENGWEVEKPKRPRAEYGKEYYYINYDSGEFGVLSTKEKHDSIDNMRYKSNNDCEYSLNKELLQFKVNKINAILRGDE